MNGAEKKKEDVAVLMLTSRSNGDVKAVTFRNGQVLEAVKGRSTHHRTVPGDSLFNWVGLDHVVSLTEIHLHASKLIA